MVAGVAAYADDVRSGRYPGPEHGYSIDDAELEAFREALADAVAARLRQRRAPPPDHHRRGRFERAPRSVT